MLAMRIFVEDPDRSGSTHPAARSTLGRNLPKTAVNRATKMMIFMVILVITGIASVYVLMTWPILSGRDHNILFAFFFYSISLDDKSTHLSL